MDADKRKNLPIEQISVATAWLGNFGTLIAPLALRLYLVPVFYVAGMRKYDNFDGTVRFFGSSLNMPLPELMAFLATAAELGGAFLLAIGLATRWICIPLLVTMVVAAVTVHVEHGWLAIAPSGDEPYRSALALIRETLQGAGVWGDATNHGRIVILQNGWQLAGTYIVCLFALLATGGGRFTSVDYFIARATQKS